MIQMGSVIGEDVWLMTKTLVGPTPLATKPYL